MRHLFLPLIAGLGLLASGGCRSEAPLPGDSPAGGIMASGIGFRALGQSGILKGTESDILTLDYLKANGFKVKAWTETFDGTAYTYADLFDWSVAGLVDAATGQYAADGAPSWPEKDVAAIAYAPNVLPTGASINVIEAADRTAPHSLELTYPAPALVADQKDLIIAAGLGKGDDSDGSHSAGISMPFRHVFPEIDIQFALFNGIETIPSQLRDHTIRIAGVKLEGVSNGYRKILYSRAATPNPEALDNGIRITDTDLTGAGAENTYFAAATSPVVTATNAYRSVIGDGTQHFFINPQTLKDLDADGDGKIDNGTDFYISFALNIEDPFGVVVFPKPMAYKTDELKGVTDRTTVFEWAKVPVDPALLDGLKPGVKYVFRINYTMSESEVTLLHDPNPHTPLPESGASTVFTGNSFTADTPIFVQYVFFKPDVRSYVEPSYDAETGSFTQTITITL